MSFPSLSGKKGLVILLHGYGSCGQNLFPIEQALGLEELAFWCPDAPIPFPGIMGNGFQWFDLDDIDLETIDQNPENVHNRLTQAGIWLTQRLKKNLPSNDFPVWIGGFSQGAALSLFCGLYQWRTRGILAFSGFYPFFEAPLYLPPVFVFHGKQDLIVPFNLVKPLIGRLNKWDIAFKESFCPFSDHSISAQGLQDAKIFLANTLKSARI